MDGWMDMTAKYGSHKTVCERHKKKWSEKGVWKNIMILCLISHGYQKGVVKNVNDLSIDIAVVQYQQRKGGA
jgi:transposase